jgi:hypothetical protein
MSKANALLPALVVRAVSGFALAFAVGTKYWRRHGGLEWLRQRRTYFSLIVAGTGLSLFLMWLYLEQHGVVRSGPGFSIYADGPPLIGLVIFLLGVWRSHRASPTSPSRGVQEEALHRIAAYLRSTASDDAAATTPSALRARRQELTALRELARRVPPEFPDRAVLLLRLDSEIRALSIALQAPERPTPDA